MKTKIAAIIILIFVILQFIRVDHANPPVAEELQINPEVKTILQRACYDCHSNETIWPWYSRVAPISWLVANHVREGREELNFSQWQSYDAKKKAKKLEEIWEEIAKGEMPLKGYTLLHKDASLSDADKQIIKQWSKSLAGEEVSEESNEESENH